MSLYGTFERSSLFGVLASTSIIFSAAYTIYMFQRISFGGVYSKVFMTAIPDLTKREFMVLLTLVVPTVIFGIYPAPILDGINYSVSTLIYCFDPNVISSDISYMWIFAITSNCLYNHVKVSTQNFKKRWLNTVFKCKGIFLYLEFNWVDITNRILITYYITMCIIVMSTGPVVELVLYSELEWDGVVTSSNNPGFDPIRDLNPPQEPLNDPAKGLPGGEGPSEGPQVFEGPSDGQAAEPLTHTEVLREALQEARESDSYIRELSKARRYIEQTYAHTEKEKVFRIISCVREENPSWFQQDVATTRIIKLINYLDGVQKNYDLSKFR